MRTPACLRFGLTACLMTTIGTAAEAPQTGAPGQATVSTQGFYMGGSGQSLIDASGVSVKLQQFVPKLGLLDVSLENYASRGRYQMGENYVDLRNFVWMGMRWSFRGGDCRLPTNLTAFPFHNFFNPELTVRGGCVQARKGRMTFSLFGGQQTLQTGPRIPFRTTTAQRVEGASMQYHLGERLELGFRFMRFDNNPAGSLQSSYVFPADRRFLSANVATVQALYRVAGNFRLYAEQGASLGVRRLDGNNARVDPWSRTFGAVWDSKMLSLRANYAEQALLYLPIAGYFAGDRKGPFAELRLRPVKWLELFGSGTRQSNNLENRADTPTLRSTSLSAGAAVQLPFRFSTNVQLTELQFLSSDSATSVSRPSNNRMLTASLTRSVGKHNLRVTARELKLTSNGLPLLQRSGEVEDMVQWGRLTVGGAIRLDSSAGNERRNTVYGRGNVQFRSKHLTAYSFFDIGHDLVSQSLFSTNAIRSTVIGVSSRVPGGWDLSAETFRSSLTTALNPENLFVLQTQGAAVPPLLAGINQWSLFVRLTRNFTWNGGMPSEAMDRYTKEQIPIVGIVTGKVLSKTRGTLRPAAGITVGLDGSRFATTDQNGVYTISDVPEGFHRMRLAVEQLPSAYEPSPPPPDDSYTVVKARQTAKADFEVFPLGSFCGKVDGPAGVSVEAMLIRLLPTQRYTTPEADGEFCFHNIREGNYEVELATETIPPGTQLQTPAKVFHVLDLDAPGPAVQFRLAVIVEVKPVRRVLEDKIIRFPDR